MSRQPFGVVIAGGGVAGLETLLALRVLAGGRPTVTLVTPLAQTIERPLTVAEPFERAIAPTRDIAAIAADQHAEVRFDRLVAVRPSAGTVHLAGGAELAYDALVVATGARAAEAIPGALTFRDRRDVFALRALRDELRAGRVRSVALALPSASSWSLPLYELALMLGADLLAAGARDAEVTVVTPEPAPLALFGPRAAEALAPLLADRGVAVRAGVRPLSFAHGRLALAGGGAVETERVVALPVPRARPIAGLPGDAAGFVPVDAHGRVAGRPGIYAAGDVTAFPLKQGGLAAQQADAVAAAIASGLGLPVAAEPFRAVVRGLLLVGGPPLYLRAEAGEAEGEAPGAPRGAAVAEPSGGRAGRHPAAGGASAVSAHALWWPPAKVAARYLGPYLATARPPLLGAGALVDRAEPPGTPTEHGREEARALALALAEGDARWGDFDGALRALEAVEALYGALPPEYERRRAQWLAAR